jgi:hypothetical protein
MFGPFKNRKAEVLDHWIAFAENFEFSSANFYTSIEQELKSRKVPGLEMSRVEFAEGSLLSDKRVYLRMLRERLVFDVCAAPFGTRYFFSCRMAEIPAVIHLWQLAVVFVGLCISTWLFWKILGFILGSFLFVIACIFLVYLLRNAVAMGLADLDATLIKSPVLGPIYERWFRKETYYRVDTRLMYLDTVSNVVKKLAEEETVKAGVKLIRQYEQSPILGELYKPVLPRVETDRKG